MSDTLIPIPDGLGPSGTALYRSVVVDFEPDPREELLLLAAARTADYLDALAATLAAEGPMSTSSQGSRAHPAAVEHRNQAASLARLLAALRVPVGGDDADTAPVRGKGAGKGAGQLGKARGPNRLTAVPPAS